jgi:hypothetical protein
VLSTNSALWLAKNGPGVITVLGSAVVAILASVIRFRADELLQLVLLLLALIGTTLGTEKVIETRRAKSRSPASHPSSTPSSASPETGTHLSTTSSCRADSYHPSKSA